MKKLRLILEERVAAWDLEQKTEAQRIQKQKERQFQNFQRQRELQLQESKQISDKEYELLCRDIRNLQSSKPSSSVAESSANTYAQSIHASNILYPLNEYTHSPIPKIDRPQKSPPLPPLPPTKITPVEPPKNLSPQSLTPEIINDTHTFSPLVPSSPKKEKSKSSPKEVSHSIKAKTEGGAPLRTIFLPGKLREEFLKIAQPNTNRKMETCGMLCGKLSRNAFFITQLVIPHQESTPDTCATIHEEILFEYLDKNELLLLGWIHTHPTQSCFMSSVDLHTQNSYQIMLKESIAIVCAPTKSPSWDIYRLTDPNGISIIRSCPKSSFHPHPEPNLYTSYMSHGHVVMSNSMAFKVADLRTIKPSID